MKNVALMLEYQQLHCCVFFPGLADRQWGLF